MGNKPIQCEYNVNGLGGSSFMMIGGRLTGPDVNGDDSPDQLQPMAYEVTYNDKQACTKLLTRKFFPLFKGGLPQGANKFTVSAHRLTAISTKGMEKAKGLTWKIAESPLASFRNSLMVMIDLVDLQQIAYSDQYEGKPNVRTQDNSYDDTEVKENPDGSYTVRSETVIDTRTTTSGKLARSKIEVDDVAASQLREAFKIPTKNGELSIGSTIDIIYYKGIPQKIKDKYPKAFEGNILTATVLNISGIHYVTVDGKYKLTPAFMGLDVAPKGEDDILKTIPIDLVSEDYSIRIIK